MEISLNRVIKRGEIYWVNVSQNSPVGNVQKPDRPAIIVSNDIGNANSYVREIVYLTSSPKKDLPTHVTIRSVPQISTALCEQITTISDDQLGAYIGKCTTAEMESIDQAMLISLGIDIAVELGQKKEPVDKPVPKTPEPQKVETPSDLIIQLATAQKEAEIYQKLYTDLLQKSLDK